MYMKTIICHLEIYRCTAVLIPQSVNECTYFYIQIYICIPTLLGSILYGTHRTVSPLYCDQSAITAGCLHLILSICILINEMRVYTICRISVPRQSLMYYCAYFLYLSTAILSRFHLYRYIVCHYLVSLSTESIQSLSFFVKINSLVSLSCNLCVILISFAVFGSSDRYTVTESVCYTHLFRCSWFLI